MKTVTEFKESLNLEQPTKGLSAQLKSLRYDGKGDWHQAHAQVDHLNNLHGCMPICTAKKVISGMPIIGMAKHSKRALTYHLKRNGSN